VPQLPPVIILGGDANALSVARSLGRQGIRVFAIGESTSHVRYSRFIRWITMPRCRSNEEAWAQYLTGSDSEHLRGAVLLACSDAAIGLIAKHRETLSERFVLDESNKDAQLRMLDKLETYRSAVAAGVPTPKFWNAQTPTEILELRDELVFPLLVKPLHSHVFERHFGRKFLIAMGFGDLQSAVEQVRGAPVQTMLVEMIPGGDDRLCSYYTYLDEAGRSLVDFTKRVIRRYPANMGGACYHVTDRIPELRERALRLFRHVGLRGLANVEFKLDERDSQLKLIECNARFTAANCLVTESGYDLASFVYNRLVKHRHMEFGDYQIDRRLWYPVEDFKAYLELRTKGQLTAVQWLRSIMRRQSLPYFRWYDPAPSVVCELRRVGRVFGRIVGRAVDSVRVTWLRVGRLLRSCRQWTERSWHPNDRRTRMGEER
jgi:predicted ATP-grasp superfamily ATP-dependent carboligase